MNIRAMAGFTNLTWSLRSPHDSLPWTHTLLGYSFVFFLLWLSILAFPRFPANEGDPSFRMVLSYALDQRLQFGKDIIYTYGPLGSLMERTYVGTHIYRHILWQFVCSGVFAWAIIHTGRHLSLGRSLVYYLYFLLFGTIYDEYLYAIAIVLLGLSIVRDAADGGKFTQLMVGWFLAVSAIMKFTHFPLTIFVLGGACLYDVVCKRWRRALTLAGAYVTTFLATWIAIGQDPLNIPSYIINAIEISRGWNEALALEEANKTFYVGLTTLIALVTYSLISYYTNPDKIKATVLVSIFGFALYVSWKHGFVRADAHTVIFFQYSMIPFIAFPVWLEDSGRMYKTKFFLLSIAALASFSGLYLVMPQLVVGCLSGLNERIKSNFEALGKVTQLHAIYREKWRADQANLNMARSRKEIGTASVDVLGYEQAIALYNNLQYTPRPVFQSHMAYTAPLIKANVDFFSDQTAPEYVLQGYHTLDDRFPSLDDAKLRNIIFRDYSFLFVEKGYLLWKRKRHRETQHEFHPMFQREFRVRFNERVQLGELESHNVWLTVKYRPSLVGRLRAYLYKPSLVSITVYYADGRAQTFRIVSAMAEQGFLLNPVIQTRFDLLRFIAGQPTNRIKSFSITIPPSAQKYFDGTVEMRLYSLPRLPPVEVPTSDYVGDIFRTVPIAINSQFPIEQIRVGPTDALLVHAPGEMVFDVAPNSSSISGRFGFAPGAYSSGGKTDGAKFRILWMTGEKIIPFYEEYLNPIDNAQDRPLHDFNLKLPSLKGGKVIFQTDPGPKQNSNWDWTVWTNVEVK